MNLLYNVPIFLYVVISLPYCLSEICCTPDVWKADVFLDYGLVAIDTKNDAPNTAYSYINGTMKVTYDYVNRRSYLKLQGTEVSPLLPVPGMPYDTTIINDYKKGFQYNIGPDGSCQKSTIENMTKQCIPENAELVGNGSFVMDWNKVQNYKYITSTDIKATVDATISRNFPTASCNPIHVVYFVGSIESGSGTMINLDVLNVVPYNIDPSVFNIPPQCRKAKPMVSSKQNLMLDHLLRMNILT
ncbi:uncharacterized protein LOC111121706 isoform X2 [Crassostrea virginica]